MRAGEGNHDPGADNGARGAIDRDPAQGSENHSQGVSGIDPVNRFNGLLLF
jgi:hypothetical protein